MTQSFPAAAQPVPPTAAATSGQPTHDYGPRTEAKIREVVAACQRYGKNSIIALAGVPGTGKSFIAAVAAQRVAAEPTRVREVQLHPSFSYEEFIEGLRLGNAVRVEIHPGIFLEWNQQALDDPEHRYVLLLEELTRANLPTVLGELLTYVEYREGDKRRSFHTMYGRRPVYVAANLIILATYNPADRSALELDSAMMRRMRIISSPPDPDQLEEMLQGRPGMNVAVIKRLKGLFDACKAEARDEYEHLMPFGHGIFSEVEQEQPDLHDLWHERIRPLIRRPIVEPHRLAGVIEKAYPWRNPDFSVQQAAAPAAAAVDAAADEAQD
jgi:hypothetical protein